MGREEEHCGEYVHISTISACRCFHAWREEDGSDGERDGLKIKCRKTRRTCFHYNVGDVYRRRIYKEYINMECKQTHTLLMCPITWYIYLYNAPHFTPTPSDECPGQISVQRNPLQSHCLQLLTGWSSGMTSAVAVFQ